MKLHVSKATHRGWIHRRKCSEMQLLIPLSLTPWAYYPAVRLIFISKDLVFTFINFILYYYVVFITWLLLGQNFPTLKLKYNSQCGSIDDANPQANIRRRANSIVFTEFFFISSLNSRESQYLRFGSVLF